MGVSSKINFNRPADTTAYTANDVVGGVLTFENVGPDQGGELMITSSRLRLDIAAVISGMTSFTLHLYGVTPPSALADNTGWDLPAGDREAYLGSIALGTPVDVGSTLYVDANALNKQVKLPTGKFFAYLVTVGGYTPASASGFMVDVHGTAI